MYKKQGYCFLVVLMLGVVVIGASIFLWREPKRPKWNSSTISSRVADSTPQFEKLWSQSDVFMSPQQQGNILLTADKGYAFMLGSVDITKKESLIKLNLQTGEIEWIAFDSRWMFSPNLSTMANNTDIVYVGFADGQKISGDTLQGAAKIVAYDVSSGDEVWRNRIGGSRSIATIIANNSTISVDGNYSSKYYLLDAENGEVIHANDVREGFELFSLDDVLYKRYFASDIRAMNPQTNEVIWEQSLPDALIQPPLLIQDIIVVKTGDSLGKVIGIDQTIGEKLWEYGNVASNITANDTVVFFLTKDARLLAVHPQTGETLSTLSFSPNQLQDIPNFGFYVAASGNNIVIYFGDSQELFTFHFSLSQ